LGDKSTSAKAAKKKENALKELVGLCGGDRVVMAVLGAHQKTIADLEALYRELAANNAAKWVGNQFLAASTIAYGRALNYTLTAMAEDKDIREIAFDLEEYFESGRMGPVVVGYGKVG
jgi:hypothetical protein